MKKLFALLLCLCLVASMTACAVNKPEQTLPPEDTAAKPEDPPVWVRESALTLGLQSSLTGNFSGDLLEVPAGDRLVSGLLHRCAALEPDRQGKYVENPSVVESWHREDHPDGTATVTVKLRQDLRWSNGEELTAKDFLLELLLACSPGAAQLGIRPGTATQLLGGEAYKAGRTAVLTGLALPDDHTYTVTLTAEAAKDYDGDILAAPRALHLGSWLGPGYGLTDTGSGVTLTKEGDPCQLTAQTPVGFGIAGEWVCAGPYLLEGFENGTATLVKNPHYAGNFEGQTPSVETLHILQTLDWEADLRAGRIQAVDTLTAPADVEKAQTLTDVQPVAFERAGYGKLQFFCDVTPTQFQEVRQAIAYLLDREDLAQTLCGGTVVHGPYATAMWQYQAADLAGLNPYEASLEAAIAQLEAGGWTLDGSGAPYRSGIRYKKVTAREAENMAECIRQKDGTYLMPLVIKWMAPENSAVSDLLAAALAHGEQVGMEIRRETVDEATLLDNLYRTGQGGEVAPCYSMTNVATGFASALYDDVGLWTKGADMGRNLSRLYDPELARLAVDTVRARDEQTYLENWSSYILRWNRLLPELPLYTNVYVTLVPQWLQGYGQNGLWDFSQAILYAEIR